MRDWQHNMATVTALAPATYSADASGITIDRAGFDSLTFALMVGAGGIAFDAGDRIDVYAEHSDDGQAWDPIGTDNVPGWANVTAQPLGFAFSFNAPHPTPTVQRLGYVDGTIGDRRYVRLRLDFVGTHSAGTPISALAILGQARELPTGI